MGIRRTGSRRIVVNGGNYRCQIRRKPTYVQAAYARAMFAVVQLDEKPGRVLLIRCGPRPDNWINAPSEPVTPGRIAAAIRAALNTVWNPSEPGPACVIDLSTIADEAEGS